MSPSAFQISGPQLSQFPALIEKVSPQVGPLNLIADFVVECAFSLQQTLRMDLGNPSHKDDRNPCTVYR